MVLELVWMFQGKYRFLGAQVNRAVDSESEGILDGVGVGNSVLTLTSI
jgi:hypothetical protein